MIISGPVGADAEFGSGGDGIDVGSQKDEFPAVFKLLPLHHGIDPLVAVFLTSVLHPVSGDDEHHLLCPHFIAGIPLGIADLMDGLADGIQQGGRTADKVLLRGNRTDALDVDPGHARAGNHHRKAP